MTRATFAFPCVLIALDISAAAVYFIAGDFKRGVYWVAAAVLTACITF
jgi:hypothetical protein